MDTPQEKICTKCRQLKPLMEFSKSKRHQYGRKPSCKACNHLYYEARKDITAPRQAERIANRTEEEIEADRLYFANYYLKHHEQRLIEDAERRANRTEKEREAGKLYFANYYVENIDKKKKQMAAWRKANPEKRKALEDKRRAQKAQAPVNDLTDEQWREMLIAYNYRCQYCPDDCWHCRHKKHKLTREHVTPYYYNGSNTLWNAIPACQKHNSQKGKKTKPLKPAQMLLLTIAPPKPYKPRTKKDIA